jgi:hypothetical protein
VSGLAHDGPLGDVAKPAKCFQQHHSSCRKGDGQMEDLAGWLRQNSLRPARLMKCDLILYVAYCIGFTLIGLLVAIGWHDFIAASHASIGNHPTNGFK